jgi:polyferredoxin
MENADKSKNTAFRILRPRTFFYSAVLLIASAVILFNLSFRSKLELNIIADRNPIFVMLSDGRIRDGYTVKIFNKTHQDKTYTVKISGIENLSVKTEGLDLNNLRVASNEIADFRIYVSASGKDLNKDGRSKIKFAVIDNDNKEVMESESVFISK